MVRSYAVIPFFLLTSFLFAQSPSSLQSETANNTSAADNFRGMQNGNAPASHVSKLPLRSLLYRGATTKIYARVVPFFLSTQKHVDVGYRSDDRAQAQRQVEDMISRGIDGAIIDWYGTGNADLGRSAEAYREQAESHADSDSSSARTKALSSIVPRGRDAIRPVS